MASTGAPSSAVDAVLIVVLIAVDVAMVWLTLRTLVLYPAPAIRRRSLRRAAAAFLNAGSSRRERLAATASALPRGLGWLMYLAPFVALLLPIPLRAGPLDNAEESAEYLGTLWQVVAAALGVTVAMVAFAFEAFTSTAHNRHGGTLREFAGETRLLLVIRLGALSLLVNGAVLLGFGDHAPAGWAAAWAIGLSAATLVAVPWVVGRILSVLDPTHLSARRHKHLVRTVGAAVRAQLGGQAAEVILQRLGPAFPASRVLGGYGVTQITAEKEGEIADVWLGPLARQHMRHALRMSALNVQLHVEIGQEVKRGETIMSAAVALGARDIRRLRRCMRITRSRGLRADRRLLAQLDTLHIQANAAIREHRDDEWRDVADLYELVLLELPRATVRLGIPFEGAVAQPGYFGFGPVQRIADFFIAELELAVKSDATDLISAITYRPQSIADEATRLGAHAVAEDMLAVYPRMYGLWIRGTT